MVWRDKKCKESLGSLCSACHLQGDQTLCSRAGGSGLVGLGVNWETAVCVIAAPLTGICYWQANLGPEVILL